MGQPTTLDDYRYAAARFPTDVFEPLGFLAGRRAVLIDFAPGDMTLYRMIMVRTAREEVAVSLISPEGTCAILPFRAGGGCHEGYIADKMKLRFEQAAYAVAAVVERAGEVVFRQPAWTPEGGES
jgi:hypothetical protein